jgi:hypothetical protein
MAELKIRNIPVHISDEQKERMVDYMSDIQDKLFGNFTYGKDSVNNETKNRSALIILIIFGRHGLRHRYCLV